jgi:hypothetical protein
VLGRVDGGGKNERFALGILRTKAEESEPDDGGSRQGVGASTASSSLSVLCANNEATVSRSVWRALSRGT